ncbi:MAG: sulfatase [Planctomycetota bacterium]|jgi:arylsulfatase A-like enzyme
MLWTRKSLSILVLVFIAQLCTADQPPNIVMIISDDHGWTDYGFMGHPKIETPHLDRLSQRSALFQRGYVPTALCRPSLATLLTGKYAHQHRITGNDPALLSSMQGPSASREEPEEYRQLRRRLIALSDNSSTLPRLLGSKGYVSFQSGKWWEGNFRRGGFTAGMTRGFPEPGGRHGDDGLTIGREGMQPITEFIDNSVASGEPFFVWYAPILPHSPHNPPKQLFEKYKAKGVQSDHIARYYAMVEWFDGTCGELLDHLDRRGLTDNTMIVYVADNGWIQQADSAEFALRSKQSPYEGGVRQPILFSWPGRILAGNRGEQLCSSVDIVPTLLSAAGAPIPNDLPGYDLMPCLATGEPTPRREVFGETFSHDVADIEQPESTLLYRWIIEDRWKLILTYDGQAGRSAKYHPREDVRPQLYDVREDPSETKNLAQANPELVQQLGDKLQAWWPVTQRKVQTKFVR